MSFSFIQITDHHLPESGAELIRGFSPVHAFRAVIRHIARNGAAQADFIVSTGDLVETPTLTAYQHLAWMLNANSLSVPAPGPISAVLEGLPEMPFYCLPGNHDDREHFYQGLFPGKPAQALMNATFNHKGVQFICLDWGPATKAVAHRETLEFLSRSLETDLPSILLMHHHMAPVGSHWLDEFIADEAGRFWEATRGRNILGIFCGHVHMSYEKIVEGLPVFGLRSTAFPFVLQDEPLICLLPAHYRLITVDEGRLSTQIFEVPL
jgi:Icc protein